MNLLCPSCQKMLQVPDQYAGQQMRCPLCNNIFTVPGLPDPMAAVTPAPPVAPNEPYKLQDDPPATAPPPPLYPQQQPPPPAPSYLPPSQPAPRREPPPPVPERDYQTLKSIWISKKAVPWVSPIAMGVLLVLSFFPWFGVGPSSETVWKTGYGADGRAVLIIYTILLILGLLTEVASFLIHLAVIPRVPALETVRPLVPGGIVVLSFVLLFFWLLVKLIDLGAVPLNLWGHLAWWAHFTAFVAVLLEIWLALCGPAAPSPRIDLHL